MPARDFLPVHHMFFGFIHYTKTQKAKKNFTAAGSENIIFLLQRIKHIDFMFMQNLDNKTVIADQNFVHKLV